jgi:hypothetical protein
MVVRHLIPLLTVVILATGGHAQQTGGTGEPGVLFVHDKGDAATQPFVNAFREYLKATGLPVDETVVDSIAITDLSPYRTILLYSRVMAFDNMSPVRDWLKKQQDLGNRNVFLFVTANRWFFEKHLKKMKSIITGRNGVIVDAVTMATKNMDTAQKQDAVKKHLEKLR